ncbi:14265_t:CDS:2 [Dentiscutata erythropus]|uniref:14265_t:CDS:1 n=1 Tax=Dentiscutata erythropus TaxID=1348616 RepID=A0A9N8WMC9_9GLOM|nr:14265_t:CDS:2 [Dentiscutata erythropus]
MKYIFVLVVLICLAYGLEIHASEVKYSHFTKRDCIGGGYRDCIKNEPCEEHDDCMIGLVCSNSVCSDVSGDPDISDDLDISGGFDASGDSILPTPQKPTKVLTIQLTDDVTVVLTGHNEVNEPSDVYMTTVELPDVGVSENQSPEVKVSEIQLREVEFPEVKFPEVKFPEIQFPSLEPIFEKIREFFGAISIGALGTCGATIFHVIGCGTFGIVKGSLVAICQSIAAIELVNIIEQNGIAGIT